MLEGGYVIIEVFIGLFQICDEITLPTHETLLGFDDRFLGLEKFFWITVNLGCERNPQVALFCAVQGL